ncbi:MAG: M56 family metallopeptidase [Candidatus Dormibacteraeota bacterium]|uniref:M56 family metallopeptidase n=1 Tax=Candidatus Amunia macphersoniae TaxID=3127014 RepID=A0A934KKB2_9BACT|nr:M56 family metallopeptidase [Candidatus Dormibacteraeota bacterium]
MRRLQLAALAVAGALFGSCLISAAAACPGWRCGAQGTSTGAQTALDAAMLMVALLAMSVVARAAWLTWRGRRSLAALQPAPGGEATVARHRLGGRARLTGGSGIAFCTGLLRPRLYFSVDVVDALDNEELEAVLVHERCHAARRDPLRRVLRRALADVLWFAPAVAWWADQRIRREEMAADAAAVRRVGLRPVAGALVKLWTSPPTSVSSAAYGDAASARVASLLGDPCGPDRLPRKVLMISVAGALASVPLGICFATLLV